MLIRKRRESDPSRENSLWKEEEDELRRLRMRKGFEKASVRGRDTEEESSGGR